MPITKASGNSVTAGAKGDLVVGSATNDSAILAVGNNGETLVADSSATTGLRYNPPVGSLANPVINGGFDIWQRGTSFTSTGAYGADRWWNGNSSAATYSRQTTGDTTNLPNIQYCLRMARNNGSTSTDGINALQSFETVNSIPFAGKAVTVSFYARKGALLSSNLKVFLQSGTGTDQFLWNGFTGETQVGTTTLSTSTLTTTWQRFVFTGTVPSTSTQLNIQLLKENTGTAGATDYVEVTGVQLDVGTWTASTAPTFRRSGGTLAGELAACQRYYWRNTSDATYGLLANAGWVQSATNAYMNILFPQPMRIAPTTVDGGSLLLQDVTSTNFAITAVSVDTATNTKYGTRINCTISGATTGRQSVILANNSTSAYLGFTAEL